MNYEKKILTSKLIKEKCFWSYEHPDYKLIDDDILIEKVLIYLDLNEINILFKIYSSDKIKSVWKKQILTQEPYYHQLNKFIAWFYFNEI
ncbi:MAG: hypothetical protein KAT68_16920 [Bacteroidales bacterium]|nr:hypothetical protein [Bacteroidales bacterium]